MSKCKWYKFEFHKWEPIYEERISTFCGENYFAKQRTEYEYCAKCDTYLENFYDSKLYLGPKRSEILKKHITLKDDFYIFSLESDPRISELKFLYQQFVDSDFNKREFLIIIDDHKLIKEMKYILARPQKMTNAVFAEALNQNSSSD